MLVVNTTHVLVAMQTYVGFFKTFSYEDWLDSNLKKQHPIINIYQPVCELVYKPEARVE